MLIMAAKNEETHSKGLCESINHVIYVIAKLLRLFEFHIILQMGSGPSCFFMQ